MVAGSVSGEHSVGIEYLMHLTQEEGDKKWSLISVKNCSRQ